MFQICIGLTKKKIGRIYNFPNFLKFRKDETIKLNIKYGQSLKIFKNQNILSYKKIKGVQKIEGSLT